MIGEISFVDKKAFNIKCNDAKQRILAEIEGKYKFKVIQKHHDKFSEGLVPKLQANPHMMSLKTNGNPYLLFLTQHNFVNQCIFIDKKIQQGYFLPRMIIVRFRFDQGLFNGTLFDGEMIKDKFGNWIFIMSDLIAHAGKYLDNVGLVKRINMLFETLNNGFEEDEFDVCRFQVKKYFQYGKAGDMLKFAEGLPYTCRGIYFKPLYLKFKDILYNFDDSLITRNVRRKYSEVSPFLMNDDIQHLQSQSESNKPMPRVKSSPDVSYKTFWIKKSALPDVYEMVDIDTKKTEMACVPTMKTSKFLRNVFIDKNVNDKVAMRCEFSEQFEKWIPIRVEPAA
jgi:hypothetical protein